MTGSITARSSLALALVASALACSSGDSGPPPEVDFHGEADAFPGFAFDTGPVPSSGPVNVDLKLGAKGKLEVDAAAYASGSSSSPSMTGKAGSGTFAIDAHVTFSATLHASIAGQKYDGPVPGVEGLDVPIAGSTTFDPFLVGGQATLTANIPETKLPPIPLPGGIPGDLQITVTGDSTVTSTFSGTCATAVSGDPAQGKYIGATSTSGKLVLKTSIVVHVPLTGDQSFDAPSPITVNIPKINAAMDLGTQPLTSFGDVPSPAGTQSTPTCGDVDGGLEGGTETSVDGSIEGGSDASSDGSPSDGPSSDVVYADGAGSGATGNACTVDGDCDPSHPGEYFCSSASPSPFCVQQGCSPVTTSALVPCDGDKGVCLPSADSTNYCVPVCTFSDASTAPTGCLAGDRCTPLGTDPTSKTGVGYCYGGCQRDADCKSGRHCQVETLSCVTTLTTYTRSAGVACGTADGSDKLCNCIYGASGLGYCANACMFGVTTCGAGTTCDPLLPPAFANVPFSLSGFCLTTCSTDGDCTNAKCVLHGGMTQSTCDPNG